MPRLLTNMQISVPLGRRAVMKQSLSKAQSQKIFEKLKTKPANKVGDAGPRLRDVPNATGML